MADIVVVGVKRLGLEQTVVQDTQVADEPILAGAPVRYVPATGRWTNANATVAAEAQPSGIALRTVLKGEPLTALRKGVVDGLELGALTFGQDVHLSATDGRLADAPSAVAGHVNVRVGEVIPVRANIGAVADKLLYVDL